MATEEQTQYGRQASAGDIILEVEDATVRFDLERGQSTVLDHASLDIRRNEIIGIVGESGSGKSMFAASLLDVVEDPGLLTGDITYYPENPETLRGGSPPTRTARSTSSS